MEGNLILILFSFYRETISRAYDARKKKSLDKSARKWEKIDKYRGKKIPMNTKGKIEKYDQFYFHFLFSYFSILIKKNYLIIFLNFKISKNREIMCFFSNRFLI